MKKLLSLAVPVGALLVGAVAACEESSGGGDTSVPDGSFAFEAGDGGPGPASPDGGDPPVISKCTTPTGAPTVHQKNIEADETWEAGEHDVDFDIAVRKNATLTIAPCAVVRVIGSRGIQVGTGNAGDGGAIVAKGQADRPIVIQGKAGARWASLQVNPLGTADLAYVTIKDAGDRTSSRGGAALHLVGDNTKPLQTLATVDHVTLDGAAKYGAVLEAHAGFTAASHDLVVKGSGDHALRVGAQALGTIPTGTYTGNATDAIRIFGSSEVVAEDTTIHDRGVPYVAGGDGQFPELSVQGKDGFSPLLTIEAGVTLKFAKEPGRNNGLFVERASTTVAARGALRAIGTAEKPIVFTSREATPAAGDWIGIHFRGVPDPRNLLDHVRIEYAGGDTGSSSFSCGTPPSPTPASNEGAVAIFGPPSAQFVTNSVILKSQTNAFERGWTGTPIDFLATNTLTEVAYCKQTYPRPIAGACPDPAPCE